MGCVFLAKEKDKVELCCGLGVNGVWFSTMVKGEVEV